MKTNIYTIWVKTGTQQLAGTDSNVFIQLFGTEGQTESVWLPPRDAFAFEEGSEEKYVLEVPDLGDLTRCCVGQDASVDSGWFVETVRVKDDDTDREWSFVFNQWLGMEEAGEAVRMRDVLKIAGLCLMLLAALAGCNLKGFTPTPSATPELPTAEFLAPANQSNVAEGTDLTLDLVGRDATVGIVRLELFVDGAKVNEASSENGAPVPVFRVNMNWLAVGVGRHSLSAIAYRADGTASSETIIVIQVLARQ